MESKENAEEAESKENLSHTLLKTCLDVKYISLVLPLPEGGKERCICYKERERGQKRHEHVSDAHCRARNMLDIAHCIFAS